MKEKEAKSYPILANDTEALKLIHPDKALQNWELSGLDGSPIYKPSHIGAPSKD